jgi:hypothetical protein
MSTTITFCYVWRPQPGLEWRCYEKTTGIIVDSASRQEAIDEFRKVWGDRAPFQLVEHAPPMPRRPDDPKPAAAGAIEGDTIAASFHRALLKAFHSDHHGHRSYTSDEILATINFLWNERQKA